MKKLLGLLLLLIPLTAGCTTIDSMLTINDDNSASIVSSVTYNGDLTNPKNPELTDIDQIYTKFLDKKYIIDSAISSKLSTITATKKVKNLKYNDIDLSSLGFETKLPNNKFIEIRKNLVISSYNVDAVYDYKKQEKRYEGFRKQLAKTPKSTLAPEYYLKYAIANEIEEQEIDKDTEFDFLSNLDESVKMLFSQEEKQSTDDEKIDDEINISFSIRIPSIASYNNADEVRGNIYTWNLKKDEPVEIKFQYVRYSGWAITFIILLGILFLVFVAKKIIKRDTTKRIDNIENIV